MSSSIFLANMSLIFLVSDYGIVSSDKEEGKKADYHGEKK
jgi:hypothetical protein